MPDKSLLLITSGQPSLNPRLVKEADALCLAGYKVTVIYAYWNNWGTEADHELLANKKWKAIRVGGAPDKHQLTYLLSRLIFKGAKKITNLFGPKLFTETSIARSSFFLIREAKKHRADLYIGHNLGALPATVKAAKKYHKPCGFDAEDFHRHEMTDDLNDADVRLKSFIESKYIPQVNYLTASSGPIAKAYQKLFSGTDPIVIKNVFPKGDIKFEDIRITDSQPLKLFWFSQAIGFSRGLENLIDVLATMPDKFELHLLGACNADFKNLIDSTHINVHLYPPIGPDALTAFAALFDIGLALEPGFSVNNNLALSNKLFTYMQAGLAIVASDTTAQQDLLTSYPKIGKTFTRDNRQLLTKVLLYYDQNRDELLAARQASLLAANADLNWETESKKFLQLIKDTIAG